MSYVEVFGGGGSVLYNKERSAKETINDVNSDLINLYRCIRERPEELIDKLTFVLNSREDFKRAQERLAKNEYADDIDKAADFYQTFRLSYGGKGSSFGANYRGMWSAFPIILEACARLQGVVIENGDFERILRKYDSPDTFFYLDPPYYFTEDYYPGKVFLREDHERLAESLLSTEGLWLLSYNDCPEVLSLYQRPGIYIEQLERMNNLAQKYDPGSVFSELLISNYDTSQTMPAQLSLTGCFPSQRRNYVWPRSN